MIIKEMSLKQYDIAQTLLNNYSYIGKLDAMKFIKNIFGSTATLEDIKIAYSGIEW